MTSPVRVTVTAHGPVSVVSVGGEIDLATAPLLQRHLTAIIDAGEVRLVVDLSEMTFCDSVGLGLFVGAARRLADHDQLLHLTRLRPATVLLLSVTGVAGPAPLAKPRPSSSLTSHSAVGRQ
ncbi:STAS domain-containing protein [Longispora sp. NPDC051575]|uniref:STAS domain-containing protein n=1 Tax=Longispora sp. NPDC051575 TaxID=3154943 RepID=UPI0034428BB9